MSDLEWGAVESFFDPGLMRTLPVVFVPGSTSRDWPAIIELARASGWDVEYGERGEGGEDRELRVRPIPGVRAVIRPGFDADSDSAVGVDFDLDLRELQGQDKLDALCGFLRTIGQRLTRPVFTGSELNPNHPVLGFDPKTDRVVLLADPYF